MSRPGTPRRPNTAQKDADRERMSFEAAEALLWGKETYNQHTALYGRMRELEDQHRAYGARIQATEAVAEAAEAATARIRHIEQQVAAIESDEHDRAFDKWVGAEIDNLKIFVDKNKNVRQKQIEFDKQVTDLAETLDKIRNTPKLVEDLLRRIGLLENERTEDAGQIRQLEKDVTRITMMRQGLPQKEHKEYNQPIRRQTPGPMPPPPRQPIHEALDASDETEDEELLAPNMPHRHHQEQVQVSRSHEIQPKTLSSAVVAPAQKGRDNLSARVRMLQRKSIYDPKQSREDEQQQAQAPGAEAHSPLRKPLGADSASSSALKSSRHPYVVNTEPALGHGPIPPPATQLVNKPIQAKRTPNGGVGHAYKRAPATQLVVRLPLSKRKRDEDTAIPRLTRSQAQAQAEAEKNNTENVRSGPPPARKVVSPPETQLMNGPATTKRRKPNNPPLSARNARSPEGSKALGSIPAVLNAAAVVKTSPRKATVATRRESCNHCHRSKIPCDNARPVCSNCRNRPRGGACVYLKPVSNRAQLPTPGLSSLQKKIPQTYVAADPRKVGARFNDGFNSGSITSRSKNQPSSRTFGPQEPTGTNKSRARGGSPPPPSDSGVTKMNGQLGFGMTMFKEPDMTYEEMKANGLVV